ncbi:MAG TPA: hypothetical protein VLG13_02155 [Patescibacteria group bacterium]|nr:hypothetical protein [Patescibacteria group bacterium]
MKFKKISLAVPSLVLALTSLAVVPVFAEHGSADTSGSSNTTETETADVNQETELHTKGASLVGEMQKANRSSKTAEQKTKACEAHKQGLTTKFAAISKNAAAFQTRIDDIFAKAQAFQTANNVTVPNWDTLVAAAAAAQTTSSTSIANLKAVTPTLDCNNVSVASDVATFKVAAQTTRDDLKAYKAAVKDVLQALRAAKAATEGSTTND